MLLYASFSHIKALYIWMWSFNGNVVVKFSSCAFKDISYSERSVCSWAFWICAVKDQMIPCSRGWQLQFAFNGKNIMTKLAISSWLLAILQEAEFWLPTHVNCSCLRASKMLLCDFGQHQQSDEIIAALMNCHAMPLIENHIWSDISCQYQCLSKYEAALTSLLLEGSTSLQMH